MTDKQLRDECVTLFLAGHETTALTLTYAFYLLADHPEAESRLVNELNEVLGDRAPTPADVARLPFTDWVIKESMRLYPPAWGIGREITVDAEVGGKTFPKGTQFLIIPWVTHRDPRWFDQPESFKPERWANDLAKTLPKGVYIPFGDGPRVCVGNHFAMMEAVLLLASIARRCRFESTSNAQLDLIPSITLRPKTGVVMNLRARPKSTSM
jgi:cytochrome P450